MQKERKKIYDIQAFDDASRGPLGSITILLSHKAKSLVCLGAVITILALSFDPFMQQIIGYPIRQRYDQSTAATAKQSYLFSRQDLKIGRAYNAGIWEDNFGVDPDLSIWELHMATISISWLLQPMRGYHLQC